MGIEQQTLPTRPQALVIGNYNADFVLHPVPAIPDWGQEKTCDSLEVRTAGSAGYTALALGGLGIRPRAVGNVGNDALGQRILGELSRAGVDTAGIAVTQLPTGVSITLVHPGGDRAFVTYLGHLGALRPEEVIASLGDIPRRSCCLFSGYFLLPAFGAEGTAGLLKHCRERGAVTLLDTGNDPRGWTRAVLDELRQVLRFVDVFLPNLEEARAISGRESDEEVTRALLAQGPGTVIVKKGGQGSVFCTAGTRFEQPALAVPVQDTTGAGDFFNAGVIFSLLQGMQPPLLMRFSNALAALMISRKGPPVFPSSEEVLGFLDKSGPAAKR